MGGGIFSSTRCSTPLVGSHWCVFTLLKLNVHSLSPGPLRLLGGCITPWSEAFANGRGLTLHSNHSAWIFCWCLSSWQFFSSSARSKLNFDLEGSVIQSFNLSCFVSIELCSFKPHLLCYHNFQHHANFKKWLRHWNYLCVEFLN